MPPAAQGICRVRRARAVAWLIVLSSSLLSVAGLDSSYFGDFRPVHDFTLARLLGLSFVLFLNATRGLSTGCDAHNLPGSCVARCVHAGRALPLWHNSRLEPIFRFSFFIGVDRR